MPLFDQRSRMLRRMHYSQNMDGMYNRYLREREGWNGHLRKTKEFITGFVDSLSTHEEVIVMGSGWLLDVPMDCLCRKYRKIYLADILHPPQIVHQNKNNPAVSFIETDLTGGYLKAVYELITNSPNTTGLDALMSLQPEPDQAFQKIFCSKTQENDITRHIISVNLMSQLDGMLVDFITDKTTLQPEDLKPFRKKIQEEHLQWLSNCGPACLVTDFEEIRQSMKANTCQTVRLILAPWPESDRNDHWNWDFDTSGSYIEKYKVSMLVKAASLKSK